MAMHIPFNPTRHEEIRQAAEDAARAAKMAVRRDWDAKAPLGRDGYPTYDPAREKARAAAEDAAGDAAWDAVIAAAQTREEIIGRARQTEEELHAEFDRLAGAVPYGVCYQIGLDTLRSLKTPEEGRAFYARWLKTDVVDATDNTNLHR